MNPVGSLSDSQLGTESLNDFSVDVIENRADNDERVDQVYQVQHLGLNQKQELTQSLIVYCLQKSDSAVNRSRQMSTEVINS